MNDQKVEKPSEVANELKEDVASSSAFHEFSKTSQAAQLSGRYNRVSGFFKRKLGEVTHDLDLEAEGRDQELLGKLHGLVGNVREVRELATKKVLKAREEGELLLKKHGAKFLDHANEILEDIKKTFFP